jgi:putative membrane protein
MENDETIVAYCGFPPTPQEILARWNFDPLLIALFCIAALLLARPWQPMSRASLAGMTAWVVLLALFVSPFCALTSSLFSVRSLHHIVLTAVAAPFAAAVIGNRAPSHFFAAWIALTGHALAVWVWHVPSLYAAALSHDNIYWLMQAMLFGSAVWLWHVIRSAPPLLGVTVALATVVQMGLLGAILTLAPQPLYAPHLGTTIAWGLTPLEDQQLAGLVMWIAGAGSYLAAALVTAASLFPRSARPSTPC